MDIQFYGFESIGWLEKRRYKKIMYRWIEDHVSSIQDEVQRDFTLNRIKKFKVRFFPTTLYKTMYGEYKGLSADLATGTSLSDYIPHEVVGQFVIDLFILDNFDDLRFASNLIMMSHGLGHVLLYSYDPTRRSVLKYDDDSGNKAGKVMAWHTAAVHSRTSSPEKTVQRLNDREIDNQIYYLHTYEYGFLGWKKVMYRLYDFRDDLN